MHAFRRLFLLFVLFPLLSQAAGYPRAPAELSEPARVLRSGIEMLTGYLDHKTNRNPAQLMRYLEEEIAPYFDFERMAYWTAGPLNRHLSPDQRIRLREMLKARFLNAMAEQLAQYRYGRIQYLRPRGNVRRGDVTLGVRVFSRYQPAVQIDFRFYQSEAGWRVYDVIANGVSAVGYYRNEFSGIARRYGIQGLLVRLGS